MAQTNKVQIPAIRYTRIDFAALRFKLNKLPVAYIRETLYQDEELVSRNIFTDGDFSIWLDNLRDNLVERARIANPYLAANLADARKFNRWPKSVIDYLVSSGEKDLSKPKLDDAIAVWFKPVVSVVLKSDGLVTLKDLKNCIEWRGAGWYRPIPRIGPGKAVSIERWITSHADVLGTIVRLPDGPSNNQIELYPGSSRLIPLELVSHVAHSLDGSTGVNRNMAFCLITAKNDLEALRAYLYKFRGREKTLRAYKKELERFLLWCVCLRQKPLSSVLTDDCEAYKDFLANVPPTWIGKKVVRTSTRWRPFASQLSAESQRYAIQALRSFFEWLVRVRYLGGNPWITVSDPLICQKELKLAIDKALPEHLWIELTREDGILDRACGIAPSVCYEALTPKDPRTLAAQYRLARAAIFLMGFTGIRREEAARATRNKLNVVAEQQGSPQALWELSVLGKRSKWRTVLMPYRVVQAIEAHWLDRGHDFSNNSSQLALLSPLAMPRISTVKEKHIRQFSLDSELTGAGYSVDGLYSVVKLALKRLAMDENVPLTTDERDLLKRAAPHAFRHTFGRVTGAKLAQNALDVLQQLMGHASLQTTSIYVQAERRRKIEEVSKLYQLP